MNNTSDLIRALGGPTLVAKHMDLPISTIGSWQTFGSIKPKYWPELMKVAEKVGVEGVTPELLMNVCNAPPAEKSDAA